MSFFFWKLYCLSFESYLQITPLTSSNFSLTQRRQLLLLILAIDGLWIWCLTSLSTIFQLYRGSQFYWWRKTEYQRKPLTSSKSLTNFYHIMLYGVDLVWSGFKCTTLMAIGTDWIGSCKSNYNMITITTAPPGYGQKEWPTELD